MTWLWIVLAFSLAAGAFTEAYDAKKATKILEKKN